MSKLTLTQKLRTSHLKRWHMVQTLHTQTVAEHSYRVYLITQQIAQAMNHELPEVAEAWALWHDMPEVVVGDIPTPTKMIVSGFIDAEKGVDEDWSNLVDFIEEMCPELFSLVKMADMAESIDFLRLEGVGPRAKEIVLEMRQFLDKVITNAESDYPKFNWNAAKAVLGEIL